MEGDSFRRKTNGHGHFLQYKSSVFKLAGVTTISIIDP